MTRQTRREFLVAVAGTGILLGIGAPASAQADDNTAQAASAITDVFGDGIRLVAVAVEYSAPLQDKELQASGFRVAGRTVTGVFAASSASPADRAPRGRFVIVTLAPGDAGAALAQKIQPEAKHRASPAGKPMPRGPGGPGGPGKAGDIPLYDTVYRTPAAELTLPSGVKLATTRVLNQVVDDFEQREFEDPASGRKLRYNLFIPKDYDAARSYPLVLFMHDAGATSDVTRTTLLQGLGAVVWARPEEQARRPCFVLAPQYAEIIADDDSTTSDMLDATIHLVEALTGRYSIDRKRLYTTGQSGGCMMSIAMDIKYPDFFAASLLVAGQWAPALTRPLARQKLWIIVSEDDDKAHPGQNAIAAVLEKEGARISRATWDGAWPASQFRAAFDRMDREQAPINYVAFRKGSVIPAGQSSAGASGHRNTWRIAYTIEPVREWLFHQHR
jgi:predicted peptidase